jgi:hypothetical protein
MAETIKAGTVLIKEGALLPEALQFESESCVWGWRLVKGLDGNALDRELHEAGWTFFFLANEIKTTVFGIDGEKMVRRAIERILGDPRSGRFNALEIMGVTSLDSERFPLVHYVTVSAHSRHIQESLILFSAKDPQALGPSKIDWRPDQSLGACKQQRATARNNDTSRSGSDLESLIEGHIQMKMMRNTVVSLFMVLLSAPLIFGQQLSKYRAFSLGMTLSELSKQVGPYSHWTTLIHQRPAVIQELTFWSLSASRAPVGGVSQILFSFYNGELYRMVATYDRDATEGLTDDDMVQAISARYGTATRLYPEINLPTNDVNASTEMVIARWEDSQNSVNLLASSNENSFRLAVFSKRLNAQAKAAIIESERLEKQVAPQVDIERQKKETDVRSPGITST